MKTNEATKTTTYAIEYRSDGYGETGKPITAETYNEAEQVAIDACREWLAGGEYGEITRTLRVHGRAVLTWIDEDGDECEDSVSVVVEIDPEEPACADSRDHDWQAPHELLGGLRDNPGVFGHGGGTIIKRVCAHCGAYRIYDSSAQDPCDGSQGHEATEYREADEESRAWVESLQDDEAANA